MSWTTGEPAHPSTPGTTNRLPYDSRSGTLFGSSRYIHCPDGEEFVERIFFLWETNVFTTAPLQIAPHPVSAASIISVTIMPP